MKPTRGSLGSASPGWLGLSTYGALARTVSDSALLLDVMHSSPLGDRGRGGVRVSRRRHLPGGDRGSA